MAMGRTPFFGGGGQRGSVSHGSLELGEEGDDNQDGFEGGEGEGEGQEEGSEFKPIADIFGDDDDDESDDDDNDEGDEPKKKKKKSADDSDDDDDDEDPSKGIERRLATEINEMITGFKINEEDIPEDFDPSDPKQFRDVVGAIQQRSVATALQVAMKPMQAALQQMSRDMRREIDSAINQHGSSTNARQILESIVPESTDPELKGMVNTLFEQARKKHKKPADAANSVKAALNAMGLKSKRSKRSSDPSSGDSDSYREGSSALDLYAPMNPGRSNKGSGGQRSRRQA